MKIVSTELGKPINCYNCKSSLIYFPFDVKKSCTSYRIGIESDSCEEEIYVVCPVCGRQLTLSSRKWVE